MKKGSFVLNVLMAALIVVGSAGLGRADDLVVSGFVNITLPFTNEVADATCGSPAATGDGSTNCTELQFSVNTEIDFEKKQGPLTVRVDLDFLGTGNNISPTIHPEQMRFDLALPVGKELGLTLTAGVFNSPIGFESQDSPDKLQTTNGQLFALVPSNLSGLQVSGGTDMISGSLIFVNDWRNSITSPGAPNNVFPQSTTPTFDEENSFGATLNVNPMPIVGLSVGYLDSAGLPNEGIINVVVSGTVMPSSDMKLLYAVELVKDENNDGLGVTLNATHGKHGATLRYDQVDNGVTEPTTLTVALSCQHADNIGVVLEWKSTDLDTAASATDAIGLQLVATF